MNLLIPYVRLPDHNDPLFEEFTYGDHDQRAEKLKKLNPGDHIFFHTTLRGKKCITAYYTVACAMDTRDVVKDANLVSKYKNPHIARFREGNRPQHETMIFGDPITSRVLAKPLPFDKKLATRLSLKIRFPKGRSENQAIGSATRSWRELTDKDVKVLQQAIRQSESISVDTILTTEEASQIVEKHIEGLIAKRPKLLGYSVKSVRRQVETDEGRIDLLLKTTSAEIIVVELKLHRIGRNAVQQLRNYMEWVKKGSHGKKVSGAIVCEGVLPAFADDVMKLKNIKVFCYGWQLKLRKWSQG